MHLDPRILLRLLRTAYLDWGAHNVPRMSAALAYYTIFSVAPILVIAIAIAGMAFGEKAAQGAVVGQVQDFIGQDSARAIQAMIQSAQKPAHSAIASMVGIIALLIGATGAFGEIRDALNIIWNADAKPKGGLWNLVRDRFLSFGMVLVIGFLLLASLVLSAGLAAIAKYLDRSLPIPPFVLHFLDFFISIAIVTALFAMIFKLLPDAKIAWSDVWVGAGLTSVLFTVGKFLIGFYIGRSITSSAYGAAGSLVTVVAWIYYSAFILYFGAEFTRSYAGEFGSRAGLNVEKIFTRNAPSEPHRQEIGAQ
jgi:membrane protein